MGTVHNPSDENNQAFILMLTARDTVENRGENLAPSIMRTYLGPGSSGPRPQPPSPMPFEQVSGEQAYKDLREREIGRGRTPMERWSPAHLPMSSKPCH